MQISPTQCVPWHHHNEVQDTFYVISGKIRVATRDPDEEVCSRRWPNLHCQEVLVDPAESRMLATAPLCFLFCRGSATTILSDFPDQ